MFNGLMSCKILGKVAVCIAIFSVLMDDWRRKNGGGGGGGGGGGRVQAAPAASCASNRTLSIVSQPAKRRSDFGIGR
jgi:hypothetical protein